MLLISDPLSQPISLLSESTENGKKRHYIEGIMLQGMKPNKNNRIYPEQVLERATFKYINDVVKNNKAYGELNHPSGPSINLDKVCHIVTELSKSNSDYVGKAIITNTPAGEIVKGLLESGANLGVSSRGYGSIKPLKENLLEVQDDYHLIAIDVVADPSAPNAFVRGVMENVEWVYNESNGEWIQEARKCMRKMSKKQLEERRVQFFEQFLKTL